MIRETVTYFFFVFILLSCKKENAFDCFKSNGTTATETRNIGEFTVVKAFDKIDLNLVQGGECKVEVNAGKNILRNIITKNENGVLTIENRNKCNFVRGYKHRITITVYLPQLQRVENNGVGTVRMTDYFYQDSVFVRAENSGDIHVAGHFKKLSSSSHGNGDVYVNGSCDYLYVYCFGTNFFRGYGLTVKNSAFIETISIGDCYVNAPENGELSCNIWRSGNIYYRGNPAAVNNYSDGTGSGKLIKE